MKVLVSRKTGKYYYYKEEGDYHCKEGLIKEEDLKSGKKIVFSNIEREFLLFNANDYDKSTRFKIGPQLITKKDLGYILARTGTNRNSVVVEAGSGSGAATSFFAGIVKEVKSYDVREDHIKIAKRNLDLMGFDNVSFEKIDLNEKIESIEKNSIDLLFLDMPDSHLVLEKNLDALKSGAFIVSYVPSITQILDITNTIKNNENLYLEETTEVILRHWKVWDKIARPNHRKEIDHTAFLVFIRKV